MSKKFKKFVKLPCAECGAAACKRFADSGPLVVKAMLETFWCGECGRLLCESHRHAHTCERHDARKEALAAMDPEKLRQRIEEEKKQKLAAEEAAKAPQKAAAAAADERRRRRYVIADKTQLVTNFIHLASREEGRSVTEIDQLLAYYGRAYRIQTFLWNEYESPTLPGIADKEWEELKDIYSSVMDILNVVVAVPRNGNWEEPDDWVELDMTNDWEEGAGPPRGTVLQPTLAEARALGNRLRDEAGQPHQIPHPRAMPPRHATPEPAGRAREAHATRDVFQELTDPTTEGEGAAARPPSEPSDTAHGPTQPSAGAPPALGKAAQPPLRSGGTIPLGTAGRGMGGPRSALWHGMRPLQLARGSPGNPGANAKGPPSLRGPRPFGLPGSFGPAAAHGFGRDAGSMRGARPLTGPGAWPSNRGQAAGYPGSRDLAAARPASALAKAVVLPSAGMGSSSAASEMPPTSDFSAVTSAIGGSAARAEVVAEAPSAARWEVVGGSDARGILVREGRGLQTLELGRLGVGAIVEELEQQDGRLRYTKVSGGGPESGWVSLVVKGKLLLRRLESAEGELLPNSEE